MLSTINNVAITGDEKLDYLLSQEDYDATYRIAGQVWAGEGPPYVGFGGVRYDTLTSHGLKVEGQPCPEDGQFWTEAEARFRYAMELRAYILPHLVDYGNVALFWRVRPALESLPSGSFRVRSRLLILPCFNFSATKVEAALEVVD